MIELQLDNIRYTAFEKISIEKDVQCLCGTLKFQASTLQGGFVPVKRMQKCIAFVDNVPIITGYIDEIEIEYKSDANTSEHRCTIDGRDKTQDIVDSTIDSSIELVAPIRLEDVIGKVLSFLGIADIKIINQVAGLDPFIAGDLVSGMVGQNAFDFLDQFCIKRQVLLTTNGDGNIVITRGEGIKTSAALIHKIGGVSNNISSASVKYDDSKRFYQYIVRSQANNSASAGSDAPPDPSTVSSIKGQSIDDTVRPSRVMTINAEKASNVSDSVNRAQWERDIRRAQAIDYTATVAGHKQYVTSGDLWQPLQIVNVDDDYAGVSDELIIRKVVYSSDLNYGDITELSLVPKDTFLLLSEKEKKKKKKHKGKGGGTATQAEINEVEYQLQ